MHQSMLEMQNP